MSRPPLEVADLIRAAGEAFIERSCHWMRWKHVKVLRAIARQRSGLRQHSKPLRRLIHKMPHFTLGGQRRVVRTAFLVLVVIVVVRMPAWPQEATAVGLKGPVHTVLTEEFNDADGTPNRSTGSTFDIYDRQGYQVEIYRYKPDGSLWVHTIFDRNGAQIFRSQTIGTAPFENSLVRNFFDAE